MPAPRTRDPRQLVREAKQIARDHGLRLAEVITKAGTIYVVYRALPDGSDTRLGKRSTPASARAFVAKLANFH